MRKNLNRAEFIGYLAADPIIRKMPSGSFAANFVVITNEEWVDKKSGELQSRHENHTIVAFNGVVNKVIKLYFRKGTHLWLDGKLRTRKWQDKEGVDRYTTEVVMREFEFLDKKPEGNAKTPENDRMDNPTTEESESEYFEASRGH